ncbi:MAG: HD-GYP domain-containing protein [Elusimicrobiota bacterium]
MNTAVNYFFLGAVIFIWLLYIRERKIFQRRLNRLETKSKSLAKYNEDIDNLLTILNYFQEKGLEYRKDEDLTKLCNFIIKYATELVGTDMGSLMLVDKKSNIIFIKAAIGLEDDILKNTKMEIGEGIAGRVVQEGKAIFCEDIESDVRFMRGSKLKYGSKSFLSVPLKVNNKVIGVININNRNSAKVFTKKDKNLISILADQAAVAIDNIQLYEDMKNMFLGTIQTLAKAIDARDPYTKGHTERVTEYAVKIAREMNLPRKLVRNIKTAALIHDIGKIGIKDDVLLKPGHLNDEEYEIIKKHPLIGEQIISPIEFLNNVSPLILYHHERYDGNGYLEGLKAEEIPIGARVINVADSFEAMVSNRLYSKAVSKKDAVEELKAQSGKQFDPQVVDAFLRVIERDRGLEDIDEAYDEKRSNS